MSCHKRFSGGQKLSPNTLWQRYSEGKQSAAQLAAQYGCSLKTIRRHLAKAATQAECTLPQAPVNLIMDTTYFGRQWGVMVLYDARSKRALTVTAIERETNALYTQAVAVLREKDVVIQSIICDGKSGLLGAFPDIPVQMCQFHQIKIIMRHLTRKPKSPAAQALRALALTLTETTQAAFEAALKRWYEQYAAFLNDRSVNEKTGHSHYTHKRLRAAYNSLKRHLPWLFTCERFPDQGIPNTTNLLEGKFSEMKQFLRCHRGLKKESKLRFIKKLFRKGAGLKTPILSIRALRLEKNTYFVHYASIYVAWRSQYLSRLTKPAFTSLGEPSIYPAWRGRG